MKIKTISREDIFQMEKQRYNAFQSGHGVKTKTSKYPSRGERKLELKRSVSECSKENYI